MFTLFKLLFALRLGTLSAFTGPAPISLRAESRQAVAETRSRYGNPLYASAWGSGPAAPQWPHPQSAGTAGGPVFVPYRPEEWVAQVADRLHVEDLGITHAAMWVMATPVRLSVSPDHLYVTVTVQGP